jgi:cell wall-associated NlpC family hydrolase
VKLGALLSLGVLALLVGACGGEASDAKTGSQPTVLQATASPESTAPTASPVPPTQVPTNTPPPPAGPTITFITSPIRPGQTATLRATTQAGASCSIAYTTPAGTSSTAQGLVAKQADGTGNVSWSWMIGTNTRPGTGTIRVTCAGQTRTTNIVISQ